MDRTNQTAILERYRKSSSDDRIFLFLDHPSMRSEFTAVDMAEARQKRQKRSIESITAFLKSGRLNPIKALRTAVSFTPKPSTRTSTNKTV